MVMHLSSTGGRRSAARHPSGVVQHRGDPLPQTFARRIDVPYEQAVARLHALVPGGALQEGVEIGRSRLVGPPAAGDRPGRSQMEVVLWRGPLRGALPMTLDIVHWSPAFGTLLELGPRRRVRADERYFDEGNALLTGVTALLVDAWSRRAA